MRQNYLTYYKKHNIIPVVDINDLDEKTLVKQRFNFYFKAGLTPTELKDKSILELCPGTGYNAYYLLKYCKIKNITLVDKNPSSIKSLKKNLAKFNNKKILNKDIDYFKTNNRYDYVLIENALSGIENPKKILNNIFEFTKPGGSVVLTISNLEGCFSEKLRYLYSIFLVQQNNILDYEKRLKFLTKLFHKHLKYLSPKTRKVDKWVQDNVLMEESIRKKKYFDHLDVLKSLKNRFYVRSISPSFSKDFIWYKVMSRKNHIENIKRNYLDEQMNFIDYETQFPKNLKNVKLNYQFNYYIKQFSLEISKISLDKKLTNKQVNKFYHIIFKISKISNHLQVENKIFLALNEFMEFILKFKKNKLTTKDKYFHKFWGIGTSIITLYKN